MFVTTPSSSKKGDDKRAKAVMAAASGSAVHLPPPPMSSLENVPIDETNNNTNNNMPKRMLMVVELWRTYLDEYANRGRDNKHDATIHLQPTPIQQQLWSVLSTSPQQPQSQTYSCPVIGIAPTGSGKTLSYAIPSLLSIYNDHFGGDGGAASTCSGVNVVVVVVVPTKELVQQVKTVYERLIHILKRVQGTDATITTTVTETLPSSMTVVVPVHGGASRQHQVHAMKEARQNQWGLVVVATPGRLLDILEEEDDDGTVLLANNNVNNTKQQQPWIILDEADQLTKRGDLGPQVTSILTKLTSAAAVATKKKKKKMKKDLSLSSSTATFARLVMVSATMSKQARLQFQEWMGLVMDGSPSSSSSPDHILLRVDSENENEKQLGDGHKAKTGDCDLNKVNTDASANANINSIDNNETSSVRSRIPSHLEQIVHVCSEHKKPRKLVHTLNNIQKNSVSKNSGMKGIVFYGKIEKLEYSCKLLCKEEGIHCLPLHGQLPTKTRQENLQRFASSTGRIDNSGGLSLLLATDVAARGVDIPNVDFVIQYDFAGNLEQYVHRCGRAGRSSIRASDGSKKNFDKKEFTVYSFFTRNFQPMAGDLVNLLEASEAWVDPNLRALLTAGESPESGGNKKNDGKNNRKRDRKNFNDSDTAMKTHPKKEKKAKIRDHAALDDSWEDDEFANLSANRIVLKRASHVSDASDDDGDDE